MDGLERLVGRSKGGAVRRHEGIMMMSLAERKERAADILAHGVARLLQGEPPRAIKGRSDGARRVGRDRSATGDRLRLVDAGSRQHQQGR